MSETSQNVDDTTTDQDTAENESTTQATSNPWDDVLRDFQSLGESIVSAVQTAINDDKHKETVQEMKSNVEDIADQFSQSVTEARGEVKTEVKKAVGDMKDMGSKVYQDAKPVITTALQTLNDGIQNLIEHLQDEENSTDSPTTEEDQTPKEV